MNYWTANKEPNLYVEQQGMVAGSELGGSNTNTATDVSFLQNLLGQTGKAINFSLSCKHCLKTPLFTKDIERWMNNIFYLNQII